MKRSELEFVGWGVVADDPLPEAINIDGFNERDYWNKGSFKGPDSDGVTPVYVRKSDGTQFPSNARRRPTIALYAWHKYSLIVAGSIEVNVGTKKEPKLVWVALGGANMSLLYGAHILERGSEYVQDDGNTVSLTPTQVRTVVAAVHAYLQGASATHAQVLAAIEAGTITSKEGVDNPPDPIPAWPTRS